MARYSAPKIARSPVVVSLLAFGLAAATLAAAGTASALDPATWSFRAETPNQVWSDGGTWAVGTEILVVINDGATGPEFAGTATVEQTGPDPTDVGWWLDTSPFEIESGDAINITDGPDTKDLDLVNLTIGPIDPATDILTGTAPVGATVEVHASDGTVDSNRSLLVGATGTWTADFSAGDLFDIRPDTWGSAAIFDADGDATHRGWQVITPMFEAEPQSERLTGQWWQVGTTVTVEVDDLGTGVGVDWSDSATVVQAPWDPQQGYVEFFPGGDGFDLQGGQIVTMSDGVTDKIHTIAPLAITAIDITNDVVDGTATPGSQVNVWVSRPEDIQRNVTAAADGSWTADFSVPGDGYAALDITAGDDINAREQDADGDATFANSSAPNPQFTVETPNQIWSGGNGWVAGRTVTVTVDDDHDLGNGTLFSTTEPVVAWGPEPWEVGWNVDTGGFEILPAHDVTVDDGVDIVRTLDAVDLVVTDVDEATDTISGTAPPDAWVDAHAGDESVQVNRRVQADATGVFAVDFANPGAEGWEQDLLDIRPGVDGAVQVSDADGDSTHRGWRVTSPYIGVNVIHQELWAVDFPIGATLDFTVEDPAGPDEAGTMTVHETTHGQTEAGYRFWEDFDVRAGQVITVTDGSSTQVLEVSTLVVTNVDSDTDRYEGTVDPTHPYDSVTEVCAWARDLGDPNQQVSLCALPDPAGDWAIDFTGVGNIVAGDHSNASQIDADGDETQYPWSVPPWIYVVIGDDTNPAFGDQIQLEQWAFPVTVTNGTDTVVVTDSDGDGYETIDFDVSPGQTITVTGNDSRVKSVFLEDLAITTVTAWDEVPPSTAFGTTTPTFEGNVQVTASAAYGWWTERWVQAASGTFSADFANPGNGWRESELGAFGDGGTDDVYFGGEVRAHIWDGDNDQVQALWHTLNPRIIIVRGNDRIEAIDFPIGEPLTIELDDPNTPGVEFSETGVVAANPDRPWETLLIVELGEYTVPDEATVTASDETGTPLVTTEVIPFSIDDVDPDADMIHGTATEGSEVLVQADGNWRYPVADATNTWVADFSQPGSQAGEESPVDLAPGSSGSATLLADGGNATTVLWNLSNAQMWVDPTDDHVWGNEFAPNATVNLIIGGADQGPFPTQGDGSFDVYFDPAVMDIVGGATVVASDGETEKSHDVTALAITGADMALDEVRGTAEPGSDVQVWVHEPNAGRNVTAAPDGTWVADFGEPGDGADETELADLVAGTNGGTQQCDDDGDCTTVGWGLINPVVNVDVRNDGLWGHGWTPNSTVTITINSTEHSTLPTDPEGNFGDGWDPAGLDLAAGMTVVVADGASTKTHVVTPLAITGIDPDTDIITGTATPDGGFDIWVHDTNAWRHVDTDSAGNWAINFGVPGPAEGEEGTADLEPGSNGNSAECDDDSDCTFADWNLLVASVNVDVRNDGLWGHGWTPNSTVTITINSTEHSTLPTDPEGNFGDGWDPAGLDLAAGMTVVVADGASTKTHVVTPLAITGIDPDTDIITGTATPDGGFDIWVHDTNAWRHVDTDSAGNWAINFGVPGPAEGEEGTADLEPGSNGNSAECDDDGDCTWADWNVLNPSFSVRVDEGEVHGYGWDLGPDITMEIDDPGNGPGVDYTETQTPGPASWDPGQTFVQFFPASNGFDLAPGQTVTMTNGEVTKVHAVTSVAVTGIDAAADTVSGTANPDVYIRVDVHDGGFGHDLMSDDAGNWTADFSDGAEQGSFDLVPGTTGEMSEYDDDGDSTKQGWEVPLGNVPKVVPGFISVAEGDTGSHVISIPVTLSEPSTATVHVDWATFDFQAVGGDDFAVADGTLTFEPGEILHYVDIEVFGDTLDEDDEFIVFTTFNHVNADPGGFYGIGLGLIEDDDAPPVIIPGLIAAVEGDSGSHTRSIPIDLSAPSGKTITYEVTVGYGSATLDDDYTVIGMQTTFEPGDTSNVVRIRVIGDLEPELLEAGVFTVTDPVNATVGGFYGLGGVIIIDDDPWY